MDIQTNISAEVRKMYKNPSYSDHLGNSADETITLTSQEFRDMLGLQIPKTAVNYRAFWENPKNQKRVQSLLGLSSSYSCKVKFKERVVIFRKEK
jgi:hypothetical protein